VSDKKRSPAYEAGYKAGGAIAEALTKVLHRMLRPHVGQIIEEMHERLEFDGECEDEDIPDCSTCEHHGDCPFEPGTVYEPPPGFLLVRPGPPPHPWSIN